jgi:hypothetical protein
MRSESVGKIQYWSFGMDYETDEIVINTTSKHGEKIQVRACEKDIKSMQSWFDLAKQLKKTDSPFDESKAIKVKSKISVGKEFPFTDID